MTRRNLINRFLAGLRIKKKHGERLFALYRSGAILVVDGKAMRKVTRKETSHVAGRSG